MHPKGSLDELIHKLLSHIPEGAKTLPKDIEKHFKSVLKAGLTKLHLVTREEFDAQVKVLQRTRQKLDKLDQELQAFEAQLKASKKPTRKTTKKKKGDTKK